MTHPCRHMVRPPPRPDAEGLPSRQSRGRIARQARRRHAAARHGRQFGRVRTGPAPDSRARRLEQGFLRREDQAHQRRVCIGKRRLVGARQRVTGQGCRRAGPGRQVQAANDPTHGLRPVAAGRPRARQRHPGRPGPARHVIATRPRPARSPRPHRRLRPWQGPEDGRQGAALQILGLAEHHHDQHVAAPQPRACPRSRRNGADAVPPVLRQPDRDVHHPAFAQDPDPRGPGAARPIMLSPPMPRRPVKTRI